MVVFIFSSIYILIVFHTQTDSFIFLALRNQEKIFTAHILTAFILKFIDVVITIFVQTSYDIFFIDWERSNIQNKQNQLHIEHVNQKNPSIPDQVVENEMTNQYEVIYK